MRNFLKLAENINVLNIRAELQRNSDLWDENTLRTKHPGTAHSQVSDIWVFFNKISENNELLVADDKEVVPYRAWDALPSLRPLILALMNQVQAVRIGRVIITRLPPGKTIDVHVDHGAPATYFTRYQIAIQCEPGNVFYIGDEQVSFKTGEIWQIDNTIEHAVVNNSGTDRIVCIVDLRSEDHAHDSH